MTVDATRDASSRRPAQRRRRSLPEWPDDWAEPERPDITVAPHPPEGPARQAVAHDVIAAFACSPRSAEWFAHWLTTRACWEAFGTWLDAYR